MICSFSKQPLTVRISVTDRCQLRCQYCMPAEGVQSCDHDDVLSFEEIAGFIESLQASFDIQKVRLTGGDPLVRKGIVDLVAMLSALGIPDLAMTTNAQLLGGMAAELHSAGIRRVNISLDSLNPDTFQRITRGGIVGRTVEGIEAAVRENLFPVKLNMVVMGGINDHEVCDLLSFALEQGCELRFLELMPVGHGAEVFNKTFVSTASVQEMLVSRFEMEPVVRTRGSSARRYRVRRSDGLEGIVGFVSPCSDSFCSDCSRLRITATGRLIGCLARKDGLEIRPLLRNGDSEALATAVRRALRWKRSDQQFEQPTRMAVIGG